MKKICLLCGCESAEELCDSCQVELDLTWQEIGDTEAIAEAVASVSEVLRHAVARDTTGLATKLVAEIEAQLEENSGWVW